MLSGSKLFGAVSFFVNNIIEYSHNATTSFRKHITDAVDLDALMHLVTIQPTICSTIITCTSKLIILLSVYTLYVTF